MCYKQKCKVLSINLGYSAQYRTKQNHTRQSNTEQNCMTDRTTLFRTFRKMSPSPCHQKMQL